MYTMYCTNSFRHSLDCIAYITPKTEIEKKKIRLSLEAY